MLQRIVVRHVALPFGLAVWVSVLVLAGLARPAMAGTQSGMRALVGQLWVLKSYAGGSLVEGTEVTARFDDGRVTGKAGCNRYFGRYEASAARLAVGKLGSTMMACPERVMAQEAAYLQLLGGVKSYHASAGKLALLDAREKTVLEFVSEEAAAGARGKADAITLGQPSCFRDGQLFVPMRPVLRWLGAEVTWIAPEAKAVATRRDRRLEVSLPSGTAKVNGRQVPLAAPAFEADGWVYVTPDLLAVAFGTVALPCPGEPTVFLVDRGRPDLLVPPPALSDAKAAVWHKFLHDIVDPTSILCAPGAVLLVDTPRGRFTEAAGVTSVGGGEPVKLDSPFEIGSNTKSFTVVVALQLQEEGVWSLDDPLSKWLPDLAAKIPNGNRISLRQLARNTSGIWDYANPLLSESVKQADLRRRGFTPSELVAYALAKGKPGFDPGTSWGYSSTNFVLLGLAIEAATGKPLAEHYQSRIFDALGMANSSLLVGVPVPGQTIHGYYREGLGPLVDVTDWNASQAWAAGAIVSTARDMGRYVRGLMAGALFQRKSALNQMLDYVTIPSGIASGGYVRYGLGVGSSDCLKVANTGHTGQTLGFSTAWAYFAETSTTVVLLTNSSAFPVLPSLGVTVTPELLGVAQAATPQHGAPAAP